LICKGFSFRNSPQIVARTDELSAGDQTGQLLDEEAAFASPTEAEFADELFVSGLTAGRAVNSGEQVAIASARQISISAWVRSAGHSLGRAYAGSGKDAFSRQVYNQRGRK
jgi:hypothetical protein